MFTLTLLIKGKKHFAASDIDWKTIIDDKTLSFPSIDSAKKYLDDNAICFELETKIEEKALYLGE